MRCLDVRGMALLNVLIALAIVSTVLAAAVPAALSFYAHAAVEYEAVQLVGELRRIQALSRTTAMPLYMFQDRRGWERVPLLRFEGGTYVLHRPFGEDAYVHRPLPLVRFEEDALHPWRVVFRRNGELSRTLSHNMTILVYVSGHRESALRVVIDGAARIRLQRGTGRASDAE